MVDEQGHPHLESRVLEDRGVELRMPYNDPPELIMDTLEYGPEVDVLAPRALHRTQWPGDWSTPPSAMARI